MDSKEIDARSRLQQAALELFQERGYDKTTAAEIAARAGVTERTFFRHFPDKREVLFDGQAVLLSALKAHINEAPDSLGPLEILFHAFRSVVVLLENNRPFSEPRYEIISRTPALYEREMMKIAALADALGFALVARGVDGLEANLAARAGVAAFTYATISWLDNPAQNLGQELARTYSALKSVLT